MIYDISCMYLITCVSVSNKPLVIYALNWCWMLWYRSTCVIWPQFIHHVFREQVLHVTSLVWFVCWVDLQKHKVGALPFFATNRWSRIGGVSSLCDCVCARACLYRISQAYRKGHWVMFWSNSCWRARFRRAKQLRSGGSWPLCRSALF